MSVLHWIGEELRMAFLRIPLTVARGLFLAILFVLMVWIVQLPKSATTPRADCPWYEDLRIWAWLSLLIQLFAYALL
jgi:hypothetical protein